MGANYHPGQKAAEYQAPQLLDQALPNQNQWYTIGVVMLNAIIYKICVDIETAGETLEVQTLIDGEVIGGRPFAAGPGVDHIVYLRASAITQIEQHAIQLLNDAASREAFLYQGRSVEVQVRKTTAAGAGDLRGIVLWGQYN